MLVDADYSQIELRVLAHIAHDKNMIEAFKNNDEPPLKQDTLDETTERLYIAFDSWRQYNEHYCDVGGGL